MEEEMAGVDSLLDAISSGITIFDLGRPLFAGVPQSPNHPNFLRTLPRRHGDVVRRDGTSAANDLIVMGSHVGTHIDALAHVSHHGRLHGGLDATDEQRGGDFMSGGAQDIEPIVGRGILLDIPTALVVDACEPGYEITPHDLETAVARQETPIRTGDVVLVRSGWGRRWSQSAAYLGAETGVPGVGEAGAHWLAARRPRVVGADSIAFEQQLPGNGNPPLPGHRVLLVESGINIIESMNLEELAATGNFEFTFVLAPLAIVGATGSPVRPLALVASAGGRQPGSLQGT